jgi:hypothetical protein
MFRIRFLVFLLTASTFAWAFPSAAVEKVNVGLYGGQVVDIAAFTNASSDTEVLIAVDSSQRGIFQWDSVNEEWSSVTFPNGTVTGEIPGAGRLVEDNPASPADVYAVIDADGGLYVSDSYGDLSGTTVSFVEAMTDTAAHVQDVNALVGAASGMYAGTTRGVVWLNTGSASTAFSSAFDEAASGRVLSVAVTGAASGYVLMEDSGGTVSLWSTDWAGTNTDLTSTLPSVAPVEARTGLCPISDCALDVRIVGADPQDVSGNTLYITGSSVNAMAFLSTDGGATWSDGWDYQCSLSASTCEAYGFMGGYPSDITFQGTASSSVASRFVYISTVVLDNDATTPEWDAIPNLSSEIEPSGPSGPTVIDFTTHVNDSVIAIDPNDPTILYIATDLAIGKIKHSFTTGFPDPSGFEMGNAHGIEGVVINDMDFYENSSTDKDLWIATKSGLGKGLNFDPTDPTSTEDAGDWVYPIFPLGDGSPPTAVAIDPSNSSEVLAGNGKVYLNQQATLLPEAAIEWVRTFDPEDFDGPGEPLESDRSDRTSTTAIEYQQDGGCDRVYMTAENRGTGLEGGVFYSDDDGQTWTADTLNGSSPLFKMPVTTAWTSEHTVWVGVGDRNNEPAGSTETGIRARVSLCASSAFWKPTCSSEPVITQMQSEVIVAIDGVEISGDHTVYIASMDAVYRGELVSSGSGFCNWSFSDVTPTAASSFTSVAVDAADADHAWVSFGNCIQESTDGGVSWADYSDSCEPEHEFVRKLVFDDLLAGTNVGLFAYTVPEPTSGVLGLAAVCTLLAQAGRRRRANRRV